MAIPVIDTRTSILAIEEGESFTYQLAALNTPTSYAAAGLPGGISINTSTGEISGTLSSTTTSDLYHVTVSATNADGTDELAMIIGVIPAGSDASGLEVQIDVDVVSGKVDVVGMPTEGEISPPTREPRDDGYRRAIAVVKEGDRFPVSVGFKRDGILQDLGVINSLKAYAKEYAPDTSNNIFAGYVTKTGSGTTTRYATDLSIKETLWTAILSNYEFDTDNYVDAFAEIEVTTVSDTNIYSDSDSEAFSPDLSASADQDDTLTFTGIPQVEEETDYTLTITLDVVGREAQDAVVTRTVPLTWNGSTFDVGAVTGTASAQGDDETADLHWRTTLTHDATTGTATGITVDTNVITSAIADRTVMIIDATDFSDFTIAADQTLAFADPMTYSTTTFTVKDDGAATTDTVDFSDGNNGTNIASAMNALTTPFDNNVSSVILDYESQEIMIVMASASEDMVEISGYDNTGASTFDYFDEVQVGGDTRAGTVSATLTGDATDTIHRKTSETFILRVEKDMVAN